MNKTRCGYPHGPFEACNSCDGALGLTMGQAVCSWDDAWARCDDGSQEWHIRAFYGRLVDVIGDEIDNKAQQKRRLP